MSKTFEVELEVLILCHVEAESEEQAIDFLAANYGLLKIPNIEVKDVDRTAKGFSSAVEID